MQSTDGFVTRSDDHISRRYLWCLHQINTSAKLSILILVIRFRMALKTPQAKALAKTTIINNVEGNCGMTGILFPIFIRFILHDYLSGWIEEKYKGD